MTENNSHESIPDMDRFESLIDRYCDNSLSDSEFSELQALLLSSKPARDHYMKRLSLHAWMYEISDMTPELSSESQLERIISPSADKEPPQSAEVRQPARRLWNSRWFQVAIGMIAILAVVGVLNFPYGKQPNQLSKSPEEKEGTEKKVSELPQNSPENTESEKSSIDLAILPPPPREKNHHPVAVIQSAVKDSGGQASQKYRVGDEIDSGRLVLKQGVVELSFLSGVTAILESPAILDIESEYKGKLHQGKVRISAPPQVRGFVIETAKARYLDLGTEFAIEVDNLREELHVFDGQVEVRTVSGEPFKKLVTSGQGLTLDAEKKWTSIKSESERFADVETLLTMDSESKSQRYEEWKLKQKTVLSHPEIFVHYDFKRDPQRPRSLINQVADRHHGAIIGCQWAEGRWLGKDSLEFKRPMDRVRLEIPGEFDSLTMTTWVRIDGFDRQFNSIMLTDRFEDGDIHWQVNHTGKLDTGIKPKDKLRLIYLSKSVLNYQDLGRWVFLALVVNRQTGELIHYVDGQSVGLHKLDKSLLEDDSFKIRIGPAELGNWSPLRKYDDWPVRNLNGRLGEFSIYSTALSSGEIHQLYGVGRPD